MHSNFKLPVEHVSDTAYLVALYRAYESQREDSKFKDPLASVLAAPKAQWLESVIPFREEGQWMMAVRTALLDDYILEILNTGVDTVINLAAGLDTRPYRLDLPEKTLWIEVDLPGITDYKIKRLSQEKALCRVERIALDLTDDGARRQLLSYSIVNSKRALVITEGILPYLNEPTVNALAEDLRNELAITDWVMDVTTTAFLDWFRGKWEMETKESDVSLSFAPPEGALFFKKMGWQIAQFNSFLDGSEKMGRELPSKMLMDQTALRSVNNSGIAHLIKI